MMAGSAFTLVLAMAILGRSSSTDTDVAIEDVLLPARVCSISDVIAIDVVGDQPRYLIRAGVVRRYTAEGWVWRAMHVDINVPGTTAASDSHENYDFTDVASDSLRPVMSEHRWGGRRTAFEFDYEVGAATMLADGSRPAETVPLSETFAIPEGPGSHVLYQAIPWEDGLRVRGHQVDRWRGSGGSRLKPVTIAAEGSSSFVVGGHTHETWVVRITPDDRSFAIEELVTKERPHRAVRTSYRAGPSARPIISEVRSIMNGEDCS